MAAGNDYCRKSPCKDCPYRTDAPIRKWSPEEFVGVLEAEQDEFGRVYGCHKNDGHVCVGWLMDQDKRYFPSIRLRLSLAHHSVDRTYLDSLFCKAPMYNSIEEMVRANYPILLLAKTRK